MKPWLRCVLEEYREETRAVNKAQGWIAYVLGFIRPPTGRPGFVFRVSGRGFTAEQTKACCRTATTIGNTR
jgi:hypothetical protein